MVEIIVPKRYMFAVEGQIYETDNILTIKEELDPEQYNQVIRDTMFQIGFMEALKKALPHFISVPGLHPNLKNMAKFEEEDEIRLNFMKDTINFLMENDPLILQKYDIENLTDEVYIKMLRAITEIPNAWTKDGKLKPEFIEKYRRDVFRLDDL